MTITPIAAATIRFVECELRREKSHGVAEHTLVTTVDDFYASLPAPEGVPVEVKRAIILKFLPDLAKGAQVLEGLRREMGGYWSFTHAGMFHGVEPDGYIHT